MPNEIKINKFKGIVNSVNFPPPEFARDVVNFNIINDGLYSRTGFKKKLSFAFNSYLPLASQFEVKAISHYYSEEFDKEFFIAVVNKTCDGFDDVLGFNTLEIGSIFQYPAYVKINNNYQFIDSWEELTPALIGVVDGYQYLNSKKIVYAHTNEVYNENLGNYENYLTNWTVVCIDKDTNNFNFICNVVKNNTLNYNLTLDRYDIIIELPDDYPVSERDILIFTKNYIPQKFSSIHNLEVGLINKFDKVDLVRTSTGINILSNTNDCLKWFFSNTGLEYQNIINGENVIAGGGFEMEALTEYWYVYGDSISLINGSFSGKCLRFNRDSLKTNFVENNNNNTFTLYSYKLYRLELYHRKTNNVNAGLTIQILDDSGSAVRTENISSTEAWQKYVLDFALGNEINNARIRIKPSDDLVDVDVDVDNIRLRLIEDADLSVPSHDNNQLGLSPNECLKNSGGVVVKTSFNVKEQIDPHNAYNKINPASFYDYPRNDLGSILRGDRLIAEFNDINRFCLVQNLYRSNDSNQILADAELYYFKGLRALTDIKYFFAKTDEVLVSSYTNLDFRRGVNPPIALYGDTAQRIYVGFGNDITEFEDNIVSYLGYEPTEKVIERFEGEFILNQAYVFGAYDDGKKLKDYIFYSAIDGNGVVMDDVIPLGNAIKVPPEGGELNKILIGKNNILLILKDFATYSLDLTSYQFMPISYTDGVIARDSAISLGNEFLWLDYNGIKYSNGVRVENITRETILLDIINAQNKKEAKAVFNPILECYFLLLNGIIYLFDIKNQNIFKYELSSNVLGLFTDYYGMSYVFDDGGIYELNKPDTNDFADEISGQRIIPKLVFETNDLDLRALNEPTSNLKLVVDEVFIDYQSNYDMTLQVICDDLVYQNLLIPTSTTRRFLRFQIITKSNQTKNLFDRIRLRLYKNQHQTTNNFEKARIFALGFNFSTQGVGKRNG